MCPALCGLTVTVDDQTVARVSGDPDHPLSRGYVCPKGRKMGLLTDDRARLDFPMLRDRDGELVTVDWDTALGDLADRLSGIRNEHGAYAIGNYSGTTLDSGGRFAATRLMHALGSPSRYTSSTIDSVAKVLIGKLMSGREGLVPAMDFDQTTLLFVIGENMVVSHGGFSYFPDPIRQLRKVKEQGEVWVFDPRLTETARNATHHLSPHPGTDFAVLGHIIRELLIDGADREYVRSHTRHVDRLQSAVDRFDATGAAALTGLSPRDLEQLVSAVRRHKRLAIITGTGVTMAATANVTEWMAYALQIVTGSFERPGGRWFNHTAAVEPSAGLAPDQPGFGAGARSHPDIPRMANQYPCAVMADEIEQGHLRALLVTGGNPLTAFPQPDRLDRAFERLEVLAVWDIVHSAVARRATHLFPSPDPLERADLVMPIHLSMVYAQYTPPVLRPRGQRRPMWWSLAELGQRMGLPILPGGVGPDECTDETLFSSMVADTPISWDQLRQADGRPVAYPKEERWVERTVLADGRWDLAPAALMERLDHATKRSRNAPVLGNRREVQHTNSTLTWGLAGEPPGVPYVYIGPRLAAAENITDGDPVEVISTHGSLRGRARIDDSIVGPAVAIPHGFSEPNVAMLTTNEADIDPLTGMPTLIGIPVQVRRIDGPS
jgi:anaerobic selenocysteine-containing dehydrogenase